MDSAERFSTVAMQPSERLPFWNQVLFSRIGPLSIQALSPASYTASLSCFHFGQFELLQATSAPAFVCNARGSSTPDLLNLSFQMRGRTANTTAGRTTILGPSDFVLYDPRRPLQSRFTEMNQTLILRIPRLEAQRRLPQLSRIIGTPMFGSSGRGALLCTFVRNTWEQLSANADSGWAQSLDEVIWPLLDFTYRSYKAATPEVGRRQARRDAIVEFVDRNLTRTDLGAREIAQGIGVSCRYVQMLLAEMDTTPSAYINERRLDFVAQQLRARGSAASVTELAYGVGFDNLSTFCKAFRRRYGVTSREYRRH
ncbi:MAG: AraC family transcriptional regulator [Gammaproteobacteria bacterium]